MRYFLLDAPGLITIIFLLFHARRRMDLPLTAQQSNFVLLLFHRELSRKL
jgi:hypothetical protein